MTDVPLAQRVAERLMTLVAPGSSCLLAVSGGPDSTALLDLLQLTAATHRCTLQVGHIDHGIAPDSAAVAASVRSAAESRALPFHMRELHLGAGTTETRARAARRTALRSIAGVAGADVIVLAHHADDQAETVLLRVLRGTGPAGLAAMAPRRGCWVRPLLGVRRAELVAHLAGRGIASWDDPANRDPQHLRSWLRSEILPALRERLPDVVDRLDATARQAASARAAWSQVADCIPALELERTERGISVAAPVVKGYRSALRHAVLAALGRDLGVLLGARRLAAVDRLLSGRSASGSVSLSGVATAELAFGRLTLSRSGDVSAAAVGLVPGAVARCGSTELRVTRCIGGAIRREGWHTEMVPGSYRLRLWRAGDRIRPLGGTGSRAISVLLREARVPPARRKNWPVVVGSDDATIAWVPGICRSDAAVPADGTEAWCVECAFT